MLATALSFHPVKLIAAAEGGAIVGHDEEFMARLRHLRSHAMVRQPGTPSDYRADAVGHNYRLSDLHAAGQSQLARSMKAGAPARGRSSIKHCSPMWTGWRSCRHHLRPSRRGT